MIKLGYELQTGKEVTIKPSHLIVTGLTQEAGKTTTLEALIKRSKKKAIVFRTKIGEKSFLQGTKIPPFFRDRSDWQFIEGLVESTIKEKLRSFERAKIIQVCKETGGNSLLEFKKKVDEKLEGKLNGFEKDILTNLQAYLEIVLPKLQSINFSSELNLVDGLNIVDLERFSRDPEVQSLIIRSVIEEVLHKFKGVIIVIPEAWKFLPQGKGNPCKGIVEEFIRQGATNDNFLWIDSQDMTNVDKVPIKQISTFILGYQSEPNEVKKTLETIPLPKSSKPKTDEIQTLGKGIFYLATREGVIKTYVQPNWLDDERAKKVALGQIDVNGLDAPKTLTPMNILPVKNESSPVPQVDFSEITRRFNKEMNELRTDFFNKIEDIQEQFNKIWAEIYNMKNKANPVQEIDEETLINKIMQKTPFNPKPEVIDLDKEEIIREVLAKMPKSSGSVTYEVAPLEKIKKIFLEEAKEKILNEISNLSDNAKRMLKYLEAKGKGVRSNELEEKCYYQKHSGASQKKVSEASIELRSIEVSRKDTAGNHYGILKERIKILLGNHEATEQEINQIYDHILAELL